MYYIVYMIIYAYNLMMDSDRFGSLHQVIGPHLMHQLVTSNRSLEVVGDFVRSTNFIELAIIF